jgi:hypothetical protein
MIASLGPSNLLSYTTCLHQQPPSPISPCTWCVPVQTNQRHKEAPAFTSSSSNPEEHLALPKPATPTRLSPASPAHTYLSTLALAVRRLLTDRHSTIYIFYNIFNSTYVTLYIFYNKINSQHFQLNQIDLYSTFKHARIDPHIYTTKKSSIGKSNLPQSHFARIPQLSFGNRLHCHRTSGAVSIMQRVDVCHSPIRSTIAAAHVRERILPDKVPTFYRY